MTEPAPLLRIGVVVPARNAADDLGPCLDALLAAGFAPADIRVVDDGSTDGTSACARSRGVPIRVAPRPVGAAAARNLGAGLIEAELLLFVDADVTIHADVPVRIRAHFDADPDLAALFGAYDTNPLWSAPVSRTRNLLHHHMHARSPGAAHTFWTGLGVVRAEVFRALGGFDPEQRMMEDIEFGMRLSAASHRIELDPEIQGTHRKRWTWTSMARTDLWNRAVPWTRLLLTRGDLAAGGLNVGTAGKLSVVAVAMSLLALPAMIASLFLGGLLLVGSLAGLAIVNASFLRLVARLDGAWRAVRALDILWVHYFCAGLGYALVRTGLARD